jgi:hypothetical protein
MSPRADAASRSITNAEPKPITKADIEAKLRELTGRAEESVEKAKIGALKVGVAVGVVVVVGVYLLGRRRGRRTKTLVEIRRV